MKNISFLSVELRSESASVPMEVSYIISPKAFAVGWRTSLSEVGLDWHISSIN